MKNTVYKNVSVVTGISIAERVLGFLYRIVLSRLIGAEGLGLYQVALSIFSLLLTLGTGGIPVTLSRMIAKSHSQKNDAETHSVFSAGLLLSLSVALPLCLLFGLFGGRMRFLFSDIRAAEILKILLVGLCFSCVYSVIRGYFWGKKAFFAASALEMSEEIIMVIVGIFLLKGTPSPTDGARLASWAFVLANVLSCLIAVVCFLIGGGRLASPKKTLKPLFNATLPITSVRASTSLVNSAVAVLLPAMLLSAGYSEGEALQLFGVVSGMVLPVLFIPATLIGSLALVLVPELSADYANRDLLRLQKNLERGLQFTFLIACALVPFFFVLGEDVGRLAFSNALAGEIIAKSCLIVLPMSLTMISTSMLNSIGCEKQTFLFFFLGAAALLLSILLLPSVCGVYAYVVGLGASYVVTTLCNLFFLRKKCPIFHRRHGATSPLFLALLLLLPVTLCGELFYSVFSRFTGESLRLLFTAISIFALLTLSYFLFFFPKRKRRKIPQN